jgi:6-pyruvoyltetrahydropterin/6-carboxytetrahydropterin synthase
MYELTVTHHFDAAHFLKDHWKCGQIHGHRWEVDVTYQFPGGVELLDPTNMLIDFGEVKEVIDSLDHPGVSLNNLLNTGHPTAEFIAWWLWVNLPKPNAHVQLSVSVWETPGCCVTYSDACFVGDPRDEDDAGAMDGVRDEDYDNEPIPF